MAFNNGFYSSVPLVIIFILSLITCSILAQKENESFEEDLVPVTHVLPKQIFNEGKPFYLDKDPVSGQLDFSSKKPAGIEPEINEVIDTQLKTVIFNSLSPNIHDYLNLPVKYSSSKFVYPLVSSSYANLKYQGNNKNYLSHNKEITASTTTSPKYYTFKKATSAEKSSTITTLSTITKTPSTIILTTTTPAFSKKTTSVPMSTTQKKTTSTKSPPTTFSLPPTSTRKVTTKATTTTSLTTKITTPTTDRPSTSNTQKFDKIHTNKNKFTTSTTPAIKISTQEKTTTTQVKTTTTQPKTTTTQAKTTTTQAKTTTTQVKTTQTHIPTTTTSRPTTTTKTIIHSSTAKTTGSHSTTNGEWIWKDANNTNDQNSFHPISSTERPHTNTNQPSAFKPLPTRDALTFPTMNSSAAHDELSHKKDSNKMSLMDLFNALAEEDFPYNPTGYENDQTEDMSHRVMASQPAPFTLQKTQTTTNYFNEMMNSTNNDTIFSETIGNLPNTFNPENVRKNVHKENSNEQTEYVRYEIQQPTVVQHYRPITSANNVVILPDQNSASFILGSQQSVQSNTHMGTVDKVPLFENVNYITEKQAPEKFHSMNFTKDNSNDYKDDRHQSNTDWILPQSLTSSLSFGYNQESNQNVHHSKVKFPSEEMALKTQIGQENNEASQNPNQSQVSFPKDSDFKEPNQEFYNVDKINKVIFKDNNPPPFNPLDGQNIEQKKEILTLNKYNLQKKVNIPALAEDLMPPALPEYDQKVHQYPPVLHRHDEFTRKKFVPSSRPKVNHSLPNILPQFRPNAKISSGHSTYTKDPGNVRINNPKLRYPHRSLPPPPPPPHSQYNNNRMPIGTRLNVKMVGNDDGNRRIFNVPVPTPPLHLQIIDRMFVKRPTISQVPTYGFNENYPMRKHFQPNMVPHRPLEITEKLFMEDDKIVNDSPREEMENEKEIQKFEPVVTLQMLKTQKKSPTSPKISENIPNPKIPDSPQSPVYVVYPVQSSPSLDNMDSSMMVESKLDKRNPSSVDYSYSDLEYQNTPFTVHRDQPQEPVLMKVKEKQFLNSKIKFPYPLEKPDTPMINRYGDSTFDLAPRIINRDIERKQDTYMNTEIPIAVAYTPTEPPNLFHMNYNNTRPEQYPQHSNNEFHTDEKNYEKDFMAPFFPSLSLGTITSAPNAANSWSIYSTSTEGYDKNYINRADTDTNQNLRPNGLDLTTKEFDSDRFQPELQGGFKPIYPPGYKIRDTDEEESKELLSASLINSNTLMNTTATTTIDTSTANPTPTSTTSKPTEKKKSKLEASLESLLFGDDEDFEDDEEYISEKDSKDSPKS